jgi:thioredoxin 1
MKPIRLLILLAAALAALPAAAAEVRAFAADAFAAAQASGASILVDVQAPWCPTCRAQEPILQKLEQEAKFDRLIVFKVDFDKQKDALRALKVTSQSTLIVFKGAEEKGRSVGDTGAASIAALLERAL